MDKIIKKSKPAVIAVIAVFILLHTLLISTFFMPNILDNFGIKVYRISYLVLVYPYVFITFLQIVVWAMNVEKYHLPKVVAIIIMAGLKAFTMIGLEIAISTEGLTKIFTPIYRVTLAYYILCGLLCFAEVVMPIFVYIKDHIVPKLKAKTV